MKMTPGIHCFETAGEVSPSAEEMTRAIRLAHAENCVVEIDLPGGKRYRFIPGTTPPTPKPVDEKPPAAGMMTVAQAAALMNVSRGAIYAGVRRGEIPAVTLGRAVRIPRTYVENEELNIRHGIAAAIFK